MSNKRSFHRKVAYFSAIALLLLPLSWLSAPSISSRAAPDGQAKLGGKLAQLRSTYKLSQTNLGEIDPASETIRLATLGLRGIAVNLLWGKAIEYKKTENWTEFSSTLEQITKLQPNFISVWKFQGWNLSYNLSVEFDDFNDRYYWVMRGINFLRDGVNYNEDSADLTADVGWFIGQKIGRADEKKQYRRLFKADDDFHGEREQRDRDNWLVAREWYKEAEDAAVRANTIKRPTGKGRSELLFYSAAPMTRMSYAAAIEGDGQFGGAGGIAQQAWRNAGLEWEEYGDRSILHSSGTTIRLNDQDRHEADAERYLAELEALAPGTREKIAQERREFLSPIEKEALDTPGIDRTSEQRDLASAARSIISVSHEEVADRIGEEFPEKARQAARTARSATVSEGLGIFVSRYKGIVNYDHWAMRARTEQTLDAINARTKLYAGDRAREQALLEDAKESYEEGLALWRKVTDANPELLDDALTGDDLLDIIWYYRGILGELDEEFPVDFPLWEIMERHDLDQRFVDLVEMRDRTLKDNPAVPPVQESPSSSPSQDEPEGETQ